VWDEGNSTDDVLVAAYEWAVDPNQDGDTGDKADVLSFSGGVSYGTRNSVEAIAAQAVVDIGTVFVASAGNSGNQPVGGSAYITGTPATASGVIGVAASIDQFTAQTLEVNFPPDVPLPDNGMVVHQDWSPQITEDFTDDVKDARAVDPPDDPDGDPAPGDRQLCDEDPPPGSFLGQIALVFKGSTGGGDCSGSEKVYRAQQGGAIGVILWNGFGGLPFGLAPGDFADLIEIPAFMASTPDSEALGAADSPDAPDEYDTGGLNVTIHADPEPIPGFEDLMTDFTSEGPARTGSELKPDISAPGFNINAAEVGSGDQGVELSGTSMSAPHVSGVATLLRQLHPTFSPARIKALLMNHATQAMRDNNGNEPVSATIMGSGRVQADESARAESLATPGSLSFRFRQVPTVWSTTKSIRVWNLDGVSHDYRVTGYPRYFDFNPAAAGVEVSLNGASWHHSLEFTVAAGSSRKVFVRLTLQPEFISEPEQEYGWFYFHPNMDGNIGIRQRSRPGHPADSLHVPWHVAPLAAADDSLSESELDLTDGPATMELVSGPAAGTPHADLYLLGAFSDTTSLGEEDIAAIGARSFTGSSVDGVPEGEPQGTDELAGITWIQFLTADDEPTEPVEFGVQTYGNRATTETLEVDVLIDAGADGVFADPGLQADYIVVKQAIPGGFVCVYDLSVANPFDECTHVYFPDYSNYNSNVVGLVVDASAIGLSDLTPELSYMVVACTGRFSGDVPDQICDEAGGFDGSTYTARLHATDPALHIDPLVCRGFWDGGDCDEADPITVSVGSAEPGDNPSILAIFPNNAPAKQPTVVETIT
jgi:subtilisin family serine protease